MTHNSVNHSGISIMVYFLIQTSIFLFEILDHTSFWLNFTIPWFVLNWNNVANTLNRRRRGNSRRWQWSMNECELPLPQTDWPIVDDTTHCRFNGTFRDLLTTLHILVRTNLVLHLEVPTKLGTQIGWS